MSSNLKLYFGCGHHRIDGFSGVDRIKTDQTDVIHDMTQFPYPFDTDSAEEILLYNILEHLPNLLPVMEELWRICRPDAILRISVPYYNSPGASQDPTHVRFFTECTFDYFTSDPDRKLSKYNYYSKARFRIQEINPDQNPLLSGLPTRWQWFLAHHFATVHNLHIVLRADKRSL